MKKNLKKKVKARNKRHTKKAIGNKPKSRGWKSDYEAYEMPVVQWPLRET